MTQEKKDTALVTKYDALPATFEELSGMAKAFVASGMFQDTKQLSQAIVKIQAGRELGLPPVYSMQNINLIRNRLTTSANTMAMLVKKSGRYNYRIKEHHDKSCSITFYERDGDKWVEVGESTFTIEDAKRADLIKPESGWVKYPRAMLFSRAISQGARIYCPDAIGGIYTDEEIRSIPTRPEDSETTIVDTTTGEITEPETAPDAPEQARKPVEEQVKDYLPEEAVKEAPKIDSVDIDWLKETLQIIKWTPLTAVKWINAQFNLANGGKGYSLTQRINNLTPEQRKQFVDHISLMRESA